MLLLLFFFFFFNDPATTEIYPLSLHDALPICDRLRQDLGSASRATASGGCAHQPRAGSHHADRQGVSHARDRSEEHTSELQSRLHLVCRLLLEKKKNTTCLLTPHILANHTHTS